MSFQLPERNPPSTPVSNFSITPDQIYGGGASGSDDSYRLHIHEVDELEQPVEGEDKRVKSNVLLEEEMEDVSQAYLASMGDNQSMRSIFASRGSVSSDVMRRRREMLEGLDENVVDNLKDVLAVIWASGKLAAAYYDLDTSELYLLPDISEAAPDFCVLRSLYKQVSPRYIVVHNRLDERFLQVVTEICGERSLTVTLNGPPESDADRDYTQLFLQVGKDFAPDPCRQRVLALKIPYEPRDNTSEEHKVFIASLIPFRNETMIRVTGGLLKFLDKSAIEIFQIDLIDGQVPVLDVKLLTMDDIVMVDDTAWQSLQIFSTDIHPSTVKQASSSSCKEGLSVFSLLNHCSTMQGSRHLRLMLLRPSRDIFVLNRRYDVIDFCCNTRNMEFVKSAMDCLKAIKSLPKLIYKLSLLHATVGEWKDLYQTIYHLLLLGEICSSQSQSIQIFKELSLPQNLQVLKTLSQELMRVVDFDESHLAGRIVAREGIDPALDRKKTQYSCLPEIMALVAREEIPGLPDYVKQCCVVYIPEIGYLLALSHWMEEFEIEQAQIDGLEFKFKTSELLYYKSPRTRELDIILGDCSVSILEKETSIMIFLTECIIGKAVMLLSIGSLAAELDCLLAMALVAKDNFFVRPEVVVPGVKNLEIIGGRHPLVELICDFVPNTTKSRPRGKISILTGPNASGKSIYLKQIGTIVIMALSGSFVPAFSARIPAYDRICTRIHVMESLSTGFSSFMVDLSQISLALRMTTKQSLVIVDEFGKGTAEADGLSLLVATIDDFSSRKGNCPALFISTHFGSAYSYCKKSTLIMLKSMKFIRSIVKGGGSEITYLYELINGVCGSSFAHLVAEGTGIPKELVERSRIIENVIKNQLREECIVPVKTDKMIQKEAVMLQIAEEFLTLDSGAVDPKEYLLRVKQLLAKRSTDV